MLYVTKFIALWLLPPGIFVLLFLGLAGYLWHKHNRIGAIAGLFAAVLLYGLSINIIARQLINPLEYAYKPKVANAEVIIVLGGGATPNTPDVSGRGNVGPCAANRLLTAMQLHRQNQTPIIFTGGQVFADSGNEGEISQRIFLNLGVSPEKIIIENKARNTTENAAFTVKIAKEKGFRRVCVVTSAFHMPRSMINFKRFYDVEGIEIVPYPCDYFTAPVSLNTGFSWLPRFDAFEMSCLALHEYLGILALKIF